MTDEKTPDRADQQPSEETAPPAEEKPGNFDLHKTPEGHVPAAWKNLPPPKILRSKPEEKEAFGDKAKRFLVSPAMRQIGIVVGVLAVIGVGIWALTIPQTTASTRGTVRIYADALLAHDVTGMQAVCVGIASSMCEGHLMVIDQMVAAGEASKLGEVFIQAAPAQEGAQMRSAELICSGVNGDVFMRISMTMIRVDDGTWRINQSMHTSLVGGPF